MLQHLKLLSGVANLASKCDCSIAFSFPDVTFLSSFQIFRRTFIKLNKILWFLKICIENLNWVLSEFTQRIVF